VKEKLVAYRGKLVKVLQILVDLHTCIPHLQHHVLNVRRPPYEGMSASANLQGRPHGVTTCQGTATASSQGVSETQHETRLDRD